MRDVVLYVLGKTCLEVTAAEDDHPDKALAPHGADHALAHGVGPGSLDGSLKDPDAAGTSRSTPYSPPPASKPSRPGFDLRNWILEGRSSNRWWYLPRRGTQGPDMRVSA